MTALNKIKDVIKPLVKGLEIDLDEDLDIKSENNGSVRVKSEDSKTNGNK